MMTNLKQTKSKKDVKVVLVIKMGSMPNQTGKIFTSVRKIMFAHLGNIMNKKSKKFLMLNLKAKGTFVLERSNVSWARAV